MSEARTIRVITFRASDLYIAQGLEVDICAQGKSPDEANRRFSIALNAEARDALEAGRDLFDVIEPAPAVFFSMFDNNEVVTRDTKELPQAA